MAKIFKRLTNQAEFNLLAVDNLSVSNFQFVQEKKGDPLFANISGTSGDDILNGTASNDIISGGDGDDLINGLGGPDSIYGGNDDDTVYGGDGSDAIYGGAGHDDIYGELGNESLYGDAGDDGLYGGEGNDFLFGGAGADIIDGGVGEDRLTYTASTSGITINFDGVTAGIGGDAQGDIFTNVEWIIASTHDDVVTGTSAAETIQTHHGIDLIYGGGGADALDGGFGDDTIVVFAGEDYSGGSINGGFDVLNTILMDGSNAPAVFDFRNTAITYIHTFEFAGTTSGELIIADGNTTYRDFLASSARTLGDDIDISVYAEATFAIDHRLVSYTGLTDPGDSVSLYGNDTFNYYETFYGSQQTAFGERFFGYGGNDTIVGYGGDDYIEGGIGNDAIYGEDDNDELYGQDGADQIYGGAGDDTIYGGDGNDTLRDGAGDDIVNGGEGNDNLSTGAGADIIDGGNGFDSINYNAFDTGGVTVYLDGVTAGIGDIAEGDIVSNIESILLTFHDDTLYGTSAAESISGDYGNDVIYGGGGVDTIYTSFGDDTIVLRDGEDNVGSIYSGRTSSVVNGGGVDTFIVEGTGASVFDMTDDTFNGMSILEFGGGIGSGATLTVLQGQIYGFGNLVTNVNASSARTTTNVHLFVQGDSSGSILDFRSVDFDGFVLAGDLFTINGGYLGETIYSTNQDAVNTVINGNAGNDVMFGFGGDDTISGGDGDDEVTGEDGADNMDGGAGVDRVLYTGSDAGVNVNLDTGAASGGHADGDVLANFENLTATNFNDVIIGSAADNDIVTAGGNDTVDGMDGNDVISAGGGNDTLVGSLGNDELRGQAGVDNIDGGAGDDMIFGNDNADTLTGGDGVDTIVGGTGGDNIDGGAGNDTINGGVGLDTIMGGDGDDAIFGDGSDDTIYGGNGDDNLNGGGLNDTIFGDAGADTIFGNIGNDNLDGGADNDTINGNGGNDILNGRGGDDMLIGEGGADIMNGGVGNDTISGGAAVDTIDGGAGDDIITGDGGSDLITGGAGNDMLTGGGALDTFIFADDFGQDIITDFRNNIETIDFSAHTTFNSIGDVLAVASQVGADVVITLDANNTLTIEDFSLVALDANDFAF